MANLVMWQAELLIDWLGYIILDLVHTCVMIHFLNCIFRFFSFFLNNAVLGEFSRPTHHTSNFLHSNTAIGIVALIVMRQDGGVLGILLVLACHLLCLLSLLSFIFWHILPFIRRCRLWFTSVSSRRRLLQNSSGRQNAFSKELLYGIAFSSSLRWPRHWLDAGTTSLAFRQRWLYTGTASLTLRQSHETSPSVEEAVCHQVATLQRKAWQLREALAERLYESELALTHQ